MQTINQKKRGKREKLNKQKSKIPYRQKIPLTLCHTDWGLGHSSVSQAELADPQTS